MSYLNSLLRILKKYLFKFSALELTHLNGYLVFGVQNFHMFSIEFRL